MVEPAERMKLMRQRRRRLGVRELRLVVPDARSEAVGARIAAQVATLNPDNERDALLWIEAVSIAALTLQHLAEDKIVDQQLLPGDQGA